MLLTVTVLSRREMDSISINFQGGPELRAILSLEKTSTDPLSPNYIPSILSLFLLLRSKNWRKVLAVIKGEKLQRGREMRTW